MRSTAVLVCFSVVTMIAFGCAEETVTVARPSVGHAVVEIASPAGAGAAEPFLFAAKDSVLLTWLEPVAGTDRTALRFARYRAGKWSAPRGIVERNDLFVNWADLPSIAEDARGVLFAQWLQKGGTGPYAYDVRMAVSSNGGETWSKSFLLNRDGKAAEHGFASLVPLPGEGVGVTWLDGRNMTAGDGDEEGAGDMTLRYATVDAAGTIAAEVVLDERTCECCATGMAVTTSGPVVVYRDRSADDVRDIAYVRRSGNGWSAPRTLHADDWKIVGCPVNGPQIDAIGNRAALAWFTAAGDQRRASVALSRDGGMTFGAPIKIDDGNPAGRVDVVLLNAETALVTWLEQTTTGAEIRARRVTFDGKAGPSQKIADSAAERTAGFARVARTGNDVFFTWTEQSAASKQVHVAKGTF
ncbi:MAG: exo-alpha-sialidase [Acidobacteriota bacterium]